MTLTPEQKPLLIGSSEGPGYTQAAAGPPVGFRALETSPCGKSRIRSGCVASRKTRVARANAGRRVRFQILKEQRPARLHKDRHTPPPGLAFGEPDDRLQRSIQYAAIYRFHHSRLGILDRPPSSL